MKSIYEGDEKVKKEKLQTFSAQFETLQMKEEEYIAAYFLIIDEIVNSIKGNCTIIEEDSIVQKILRTLPPRFNSKVSVLEYRANFDKLTKMSCMEFSLL